MISLSAEINQLDPRISVCISFEFRPHLYILKCRKLNSVAPSLTQLPCPFLTINTIMTYIWQLKGPPLFIRAKAISYFGMLSTHITIVSRNKGLFHRNWTIYHPIPHQTLSFKKQRNILYLSNIYPPIIQLFVHSGSLF